MIVTLNPEAIQYVRDLAVQRHEDVDCDLLFHPEYSGNLVNYAGTTGEVAFCEYLGLDYHQQVKSAPQQKKFDLVLSSGETVEIKTCLGKGLSFIMPHGRNFRADYGAVCRYMNPSKVELIGWFNKQTWKENHDRRDFGVGERYYLDAIFLNRI